MRRTAVARGKAVLRRHVAGADDRRLERTLGRPAGLRLLFAAFTASYAPPASGAPDGEVACVLRSGDGQLRAWTVTFGPSGAVARPGRGTDPRLTATLSVADIVRLAAGQLDAGAAMLTGRLDLAGDAALAMRLAELLDAG